MNHYQKLRKLTTLSDKESIFSEWDLVLFIRW